MQKEDIRTLFLRQFVSALIKNSKKHSDNTEKKEIILPDYIPKQQINVNISNAPQLPDIPKLPEVPPLPEIPKLPELPNAPHTSETQANLKANTITGYGMEKISKILKDPAVSSIESPGPEKNIIVNKSGRKQIAPATLSEEEIQSILEDFSKKTNIPLLPGIFKAIHESLIITAVISKFVGSRFIIQKRRPY